MSARDRFVATASRLFQEKGFGATSVNEIAKVGQVPIGSLYYYFPGGKEELGAAAVLYGARGFAEVLREGLASSDEPGQALAACAHLLADRLEASEWRDGCPVATVALETVHRSKVLQTAADEALGSWVELVASRLAELGIEQRTADEIAAVVIAVLEGAELMGRVSKSRAALEAAGRRMPLLVGAAS